jgi:hypothetical protein
MGDRPPSASNTAFAGTDRVGPLGGDDRKDGLKRRSRSRRRDARIAGRAVVNTDPASASEHYRSASKAVAQNGPSDLEPSARDENQQWTTSTGTSSLPLSAESTTAGLIATARGR